MWLLFHSSSSDIQFISVLLLPMEQTCEGNNYHSFLYEWRSCWNCGPNEVISIKRSHSVKCLKQPAIPPWIWFKIKVSCFSGNKIKTLVSWKKTLFHSHTHAIHMEVSRETISVVLNLPGFKFMPLFKPLFKSAQEFFSINSFWQYSTNSVRS